MDIPKEVYEIIKVLNDNDFEAFIVGGCVRDYILGTAPKDWDITTSAVPEEIKLCFSHTVDTGIEHGTVTVVLNHNNFEVTTYRIDGKYLDNRHPESVTFTKNIHEDLSRRDFTMNAIAYNTEENRFIDPFDGREDIKKCIIRGVGDAELRFKEDALRMMRAVRFSAQLGFDIEERTYKALKENAELIKNVSIERIRDEFLKLIISDYAERIKLLFDTGLIKFFLPEIEDIIKNNFSLTAFAFERLEKDISVRLAFLFKDFECDRLTVILKRLRLDKSMIKEISAIVSYYSYPLSEGYYNTRVILSKIDKDIFKKVLNIRFIVNNYCKNLTECKKIDNIYDEIDDIIKRDECYSLKNLAVNGNDIKEYFGLKNGKDVGEYLKAALDTVMRDPSKNDKEILINSLEAGLAQ